MPQNLLKVRKPTECITIIACNWEILVPDRIFQIAHIFVINRYRLLLSTTVYYITALYGL